MTVTAIFTNKGGVGKSSFSANFAHALARSGRRTLLLDLDPQCDSSNLVLSEAGYDQICSLGQNTTVSHVLKPVWRGEGYLSEIEPTYSERWGISVLPGSIELGLYEDLLSGDWRPAQSGDPRGLRTTAMFAHLTNILRRDFDEIVIDCSPSLSSINRAALLAADGFISPIGADTFSLKSMGNVARWLDRWAPQWTRGLELLGEQGDAPEDLLGFRAPQAPRFMGVVPMQLSPKHEFNEQAMGKLAEGTLRLAEVLGQLNAQDQSPDYACAYPQVSYHGFSAHTAQSNNLPYALLAEDGEVAGARDLADTYTAIANAYLYRCAVQMPTADAECGM